MTSGFLAPVAMWMLVPFLKLNTQEKLVLQEAWRVLFGSKPEWLEGHVVEDIQQAGDA